MYYSISCSVTMWLSKCKQNKAVFLLLVFWKFLIFFPKYFSSIVGWICGCGTHDTKDWLNFILLIFLVFLKFTLVEFCCLVCLICLCISQSDSCSVVSNSLQLHGLYSQRNSTGQNIGVGSLSLLQGIFPTQESNQGLLHYRRILYQLAIREAHLCIRWFSNFSLNLNKKVTDYSFPYLSSGLHFKNVDYLTDVMGTFLTHYHY